jgi:uncharacterized repeat protein (TIGR03803 family)
MMISGLGRSLVIFGALSILAACGSQSSIDTPGAMPQAHHIRTASSYQVLHSFGGSGDGDNPSAGLVVCCNIEATLYGTTYGGGANCSQGGGCGTVFSVTTSGTESVLYSFKGSEDGSSPDAGLLNVNDTLYGTTYTGGANEDGTVFSVTPSGTETVLYRFKGTPGDGANPIADLIHRKVRKGTLYGTTFFGGAHGDGTVFSVTTSGNSVARETALTHRRASSTSTARSTARPMAAAPTATERSSRSRHPARRPYATVSAARETAVAR